MFYLSRRFCFPDENRYNPDDMPLRETQALLKQQGKNKTTFEEKYKVFMKIRERFRPVLRHYFTESNKQPVVWYAKRLTYSRSAAACSIGKPQFVLVHRLTVVSGPCTRAR